MQTFSSSPSFWNLMRDNILYPDWLWKLVYRVFSFDILLSEHVGTLILQNQDEMLISEYFPYETEAPFAKFRNRINIMLLKMQFFDNT